MDAFEARLRFVDVIKHLHKTLHKKRDTSPSADGDSATGATGAVGSANGSNAASAAAAAVAAAAAAAAASSSSSSGAGGASSSSLADPVQFYLKHYEHHYEDFHQCFFLTTTNMDSLDRLNVLIYWSRIVSSLWARCLKNVDGQWNVQGKVMFEYLLLDLNRMLDLVLPKQDWKSLTNLSVSIEVLRYITSLVKSEEPQIDECWQLLARSREEIVNQFTEQEWACVNGTQFDASALEWVQATQQERCDASLLQCVQLLVDRRRKAFLLQEYYRKHNFLALPTSSLSQTLLHRMENDRERHKKSKEHEWVIDRVTMTDTVEFDALWNSYAQGMNRNDYQNIKTIQEIAQQSYMYLDNSALEHQN
ncbi:unnamed protein product [Kluyveromyces dobzhanskii CBS 2104]|uniref:WGS project CCBQ000000000 data, contig 00098 n=1 Tax=Kluyveromyces dobzhanskii CBS 2104 TaxID=1427455 RepID=A0A0A8L3J1_9SACH|nr:unnamed protein product [Kluyveromyces dobzhanskii CBS 2104]